MRYPNHCSTVSSVASPKDEGSGEGGDDGMGPIVVPKEGGGPTPVPTRLAHPLERCWRPIVYSADWMLMRQPSIRTAVLVTTDAIA